MKIKVDFDACESNALCEAIAPTHFEVDEDDYLQILQEDVSDADLATIQRAVASCPKAAITLVEE